MGLLLVCSACLLQTFAQKKNFSYQFYGFVRADLFYDTRDNECTLSDNFYLYPKDRLPDDAGQDLNAQPSGSFYTFTTRLGLDVTGPLVGKATPSAKVEADFCGFGANNTMLRIRQAYVNLQWEHSSVLIGQTWHPLFGDVSPTVLNLSTGAPFQPFNRSPQLQYRYQNHSIAVTASAIYQLGYLSTGPKGKDAEYLKNGMIPELYAGIDYRKEKVLAGVGVEMISLKPRTLATVTEIVDGETTSHTYKVNERITTPSFEAHVKYTEKKYRLAAKTVYGKNLCHLSIPGGYGVASENPETGQRTYTPFTTSSTWVNGIFGSTYQVGIYGGYIKNLGTDKPLMPLADGQYGSALNADQIVCGAAHFSYNLPHWKAGIELNCTTVYYGETKLSTGRVDHTHPVTNLRVLGQAIYYF
ncbi:MAG: hypothetical protein J1E02_06270 [Coprobacter sp.]|nr:hypothetical protein [Coprobacter sp.]